MLPAVRRLTRPYIVAAVKTGRTVSDDGLALKFLAQTSEIASKFAIILTGQSTVGAVRRNLLKRRTRHVLRRYLPEVKPGFFGVFLVPRLWQDKTLAELDEKIVFLLRRAKILP